MIEKELKDQWQAISNEAEKLLAANSSYEEGLLVEAADESTEISEQQTQDIEKVSEDCMSTLTKVGDLVKFNLWGRYGRRRVLFAIGEAERAKGEIEEVPLDQLDYDCHEKQLHHLEELAAGAEKEISVWRDWAPVAAAEDMEQRLQQLMSSKNKLRRDREAKLGRARKATEEDDRARRTAADNERQKADGEERAHRAQAEEEERTKRTQLILAQQAEIEARAELVKAQQKALEEAQTNGAGAQGGHVATGATPKVRLKPISLPTFSGSKREYYRWRKDWESLQKQGDPSGSLEVKKFQLLESIEKSIVQDLRLASQNTADDVFRVLENRFGNKNVITNLIVAELQKISPVKEYEFRKVIDLIRITEKALADLIDLDNVAAIKNPMVTEAIESKLPLTLKKEWLTFKEDPRNNVQPENYFDALLDFLQKQERILERLAQLDITEAPEKTGKKFASTRATERGSVEGDCIVCGDKKHRGRLFACKKFRGLDFAARKVAARKSRACRLCLASHGADGECNVKFLCNKAGCKKGESSDHHYLLCPKRDGRKDGEKEKEAQSSSGGSAGSLTVDQEEFLSQLTPEVAQQARRVFTNKTAVTRCTDASGRRLLEENGLDEYPVLMMLLKVTANNGQRIGALIDLASDTNYISHAAARRLGLKSEKITLVLTGVGGMTVTAYTRRYLLKVRMMTPEGVKAHQMVCYGLDEIAKVHHAIEPQQLRRFFPEVKAQELVRPKSIELLISIREGRLVPGPVKVVGDLVLWDGPLGKTVGGAHPELFEGVETAIYESNTHFARSMRTAAAKYEEIVERAGCCEETRECGPRQEAESKVRTSMTTNKEVLEWWKWESIGAACEPKCGGCRCGGCQPGGKEMSLAEEKELEKIKEGLSYITSDHHSDAPHWDASYPWTEDPTSLPNNRGAVMATFLKTEKRLLKQPEWRTAYREEVHEMVRRGAAVRLTPKEIEEWKGPVWYVSHLVAPNPHSVTTPVRLVWNSSQAFRGVSMNDLLMKGPDVLNPIRAVLLRFRTGEHAALGDISKMYNSVWLKDREVHLHRFLWRDNPEEDIREYAITRVNIGDRPAGCIAQLAMRETAGLPQFIDREEERRVLEKDSYVDDILTSHDDLEVLDAITSGVEEILKAGGFSLKPWVRSRQGGRRKDEAKGEMPEATPKALVLPNQLRDEDNKALGIGYLVEADQLYVMMSINFSKRRGKMRTGLNLKEGEVRENTPKGLSRRELLSQVAALYDPIGLVSPAKQKGNILVRRAFQEAGSGSSAKETWDDPISPGLREEAMKLFEEYVRLGEIKFHRSLTPSGWRGRPWGITFSDGSDHAYGAVLYVRWETQQGIEVRLVESKAKLAPLDQKGDAVRAEVCGAVFATRLRKYVEQHSRLQIERWVHLVDSRTVLGAIQRESYGYQSFFANRIGEIQKAGSPSEWWWIPGECNVADGITRGAGPEELDEDSAWQKGPSFLEKPFEEWPVKSAAEVAADARESLSKLKRKAFSLVLTRAQAKENPSGIQDEVNKTKEDKVNQTEPEQDLRILKESQPPEDKYGRRASCAPITDLVNPERYSGLSRLCRVVAWVWRAARKWLEKRSSGAGRAGTQVEHLDNQETVLSPKEREDALQYLFLAAQKDMSLPVTTINRLVVCKDENTGLLMCKGRVPVWDGVEAAVPVLPHGVWISTLLARESHGRSHEGVAGTLLRMRKKAWVLQGRRIAKKVVDSCVLCRKERARRCRQVMSDLPPERTTPALPFTYTTLDLFGPFEVRDGKRRRVSLKVWGVVFCCMSSRAVHVDVVEDQSSQGLLTTYMRFTALRGHPSQLWSDPGTNFVGARPALEELYGYLSKVDKVKLEEEAACHGTEWKWKFHPADSPHRNGAAEAAVRVVKRALRAIDMKGPFTLVEFQTLLYLAANLANERPIEARIQAQEDDVIEYLSPNSLLLGRTGPKGDTEGFKWDYPFQRFQAVQAAVSEFWRRWSQLAGPNLFTRPKWHTKERNVAVGDLVWLADQNALRCQYRLGRVVQVVADPAGVVRDVQVRTVPGRPASQEGTKTREKKGSGKLPGVVLHRDVRRIVVLLPIEEQGTWT